jgi:hypothetical protein
MNKQIIILCMVIVFASFIVRAEDKNITLDTAYYYNGDVKQSFDYNDDTLYVNPGTTLQIQLKYQNDYTSDVSVETKGTLNLIEDLSDKKTTTVSFDDKATAVIAFDIPSETKYGDYDLNIQYKWTYNGTTWIEKATQTVNVKKTTLTTTQSTDLWVNLTRELVDQKIVTNRLLSTNYNCSMELATCKEQLGTQTGTCTSKEDFKGLYTQKCTDYDSLNSQLLSCRTELGGKITEEECKIREATAKDSGSNSAWTTALVVGVILGLIIFFLVQSRKKKDSQEGIDMMDKGSQY